MAHNLDFARELQKNFLALNVEVCVCDWSLPNMTLFCTWRPTSVSYQHRHLHSLLLLLSSLKPLMQCSISVLTKQKYCGTVPCRSLFCRVYIEIFWLVSCRSRKQWKRWHDGSSWRERRWSASDWRQCWRCSTCWSSWGRKAWGKTWLSPVGMPLYSQSQS